MIEFALGDVLLANADALLLTIDGAKRGLEGNVARSFARRWPDAWMEIEDEIRYPIPLGRTVATHPENESNFSIVLIASTLHHLDVLADDRKVGIIRSALSEAIQLSIRHRVRKLVTAPMTGGWRLPLETALSAMMSCLKTVGAKEHALTVVVHFLSLDHLHLATELATVHRIDVLLPSDPSPQPGS